MLWLIPESVGWKIRTIPDVVLWADTFAGVSGPGRLASALDVGAGLHVHSR